ncbi:hypothetical protein [Staphylococcus pseudintermedius]|nr:hypothetical protein [Staphylococcus pseudintermedius]MDT0878936.1 hypothetical protein [Staphylococcus pseudintermedius]
MKPSSFQETIENQYKRQDKYVQFCLNKNAQLYSFSEGKWFFNL